MTNKYSVLALLIILVIVMAIGAIFYINKVNGLNSPLVEGGQPPSKIKNKTDKKFGLAIGDYAPDFVLEDLQGEEFSLSDSKGKYLLLNFWATWCPACREEMPDLKQFYLDNKNDVVVVGVNLGESKKVVQNFITKGGYGYPILMDYTKELSYIYQISVIPTTYLISPEGRIEYVKRGLITREELNQLKEEFIK